MNIVCRPSSTAHGSVARGSVTGVTVDAQLPTADMTDAARPRTGSFAISRLIGALSGKSASHVDDFDEGVNEHAAAPLRDNTARGRWNLLGNRVFMGVVLGSKVIQPVHRARITRISAMPHALPPDCR